jgi:glucose/arabinose dehydrogenase
MSSALESYDVEVLHTKTNQVIWGFDFLKDGSVIYTQRDGKLCIFNSKTRKDIEVTGVPKVHASGQGGLLDIRVHPKNDFIYLTYSKPLANDESATTLARFKINVGKITEIKEIFISNPPSKNDYHFGSRIEFDEKGHVFITSGERGERPLVQKMDNHFGKIIRINEDGSSPMIYARGIRSPQGLSKRPGTDEIWEAEMGPQGGDEINILKEGANYGWPVITFGKEYEGPKIGEGTQKKGMEQPVAYWVPSISPSAMTFWKNDIWLATLSGQHLRRLLLKDHKVISQEKYFESKGWRFRNVRPGPDGQLWFSTDEGRIGRIVNK